MMPSMSSESPRPVRPLSVPVRRRRRPLAQSPGSLVHRGEKRVESAHLRLIAYNDTFQDFKTLDSVPEAGLVGSSDHVTWLHLTGLHEVDEIAKVGRAFGISTLVLEDILHTGSRSKIENHESEIFIVTRIVTDVEKDGICEVQHFSLLLLPGNLVLTFCETPTTVFDPVIDRIRSNVGGRIRRHGADYLAWALLDAIVDNYLSVIDHLDDSVVAIDEKLQLDDRSVHAGEIYALKREINRVFRSIRPIREIAISLLRENETLLTPASRPYYIDLNDHAIQAIETTEYLREGSNSLREFYLSSASHRMNEVMKVLTCFSTIFLPLTFIAGIYGMNFEHMPELQHRWAYPTIWIVFLLCAAGMFWLFRRMRWL
jgi:magnesium transporter